MCKQLKTRGYLECPYSSINENDEFVCMKTTVWHVIPSVNDLPVEIPQWCPLGDYDKA